MNVYTSQVARFVRIFVFTIAPALLLFITGQSPFTIATVTPPVAGALETAWRAIHPTVAASTSPPPSSSTGYTAV